MSETVKRISPGAEAADFRAGDEVRYIPFHACGDAQHKDCENGVVSSTNDQNVFVRYYRNGMLQQTAQATYPSDLIIVRRRP